MAIEEFGESLLANVRTRKDEQAKKARKRERTSVLTGLATKAVISFADKAFEKKTNAFLQNEKMLASKTKYKSAVNGASNILNQQKLISESGKSGTEYFMDKMRPVFEEKSLEYVSPKISGDERLFDRLITQKLTPLAEKQAREHEEGLAYASNIGPFASFDADILKQVKGAKPQNLIEAAASGAMRLFSGKTEAEQEADVVTSIQTGPMSKSADAMIAFNERYKETKNAVMSYDYANLVASEDLMRQIESEKPDIKVEKAEQLQQLNNEVYVVTSTTTTDTLSGTTDTKQTYTKDTTFDNPETASKELAKSMQSTFNLATQPLQALTPSAYANYVKEAQNNGLDIMNSTDPLNYTSVAAIYTNYAANKNNLKDDFKADVFVATMSEFVKESESLDILLSGLKNIKDPTSPEYKEALEEIKVTRLNWATTAAEISEVATQVAQGQGNVSSAYNAGTVSRDITSNVHGYANYDNLSVQQQIKMDSLSPDEYAENF